MLHPDAALAREVRAEHGWEGRKIVLYFGAMGEANNLSVILRAAERLRQSDCLFVLIGDGMKRHDLMQQAEAMNLNNVLILPSISKQHARGYISAADICLVTLRDIPLFGGAIPTKLLDYMACARPVLCGIGGEAAEITEAAGSGYRFSPDDDAELARLIETVIDDPALLQSLGNSGLAHVREHYGAGQAHLKMEAVLGEAAGYPIRQPLP